jgi:polar amino acid transport system substrate-binding protein
VESSIRFAFLQEPPFCYREGSGVVAGCDVDLARHVLAAAGHGVLDPVEATFAELLPGLDDGRWSMTTGLFVTDERRDIATFSRPIWALSDGLLIVEGMRDRIKGYRSIAADGRLKLVVVRGQVQRETALRNGVPDARMLIVETQAEAAQAVIDRRADAYASVAMAHHGLLARMRETGLAVATAADDEAPPAFGAFAFSKGNAKLLSDVNAGLDAFLGSAEHRSLLSAYGFLAEEISRVC